MSFVISGTRQLIIFLLRLARKNTCVPFSMIEIAIMSEGAFLDSLKRNNAKIREDRAAAIAEDAELMYKREVEDLAILVRKLKREQENMLDMSPTDADSLVLAADFDSREYVRKDIELGTKIRNLEIKMEIAQRRYEYLFGRSLELNN
ncbi:MAG: hypothetical protein KDK39_04500 [Leptospiraceae bacterium]|nr:hypothetical protein [Leptospiraceae bacterium]